MSRKWNISFFVRYGKYLLKNHCTLMQRAKYSHTHKTFTFPTINKNMKGIFSFVYKVNPLMCDVIVWYLVRASDSFSLWLQYAGNISARLAQFVVISVYYLDTSPKREIKPDGAWLHWIKVAWHIGWHLDVVLWVTVLHVALGQAANRRPPVESTVSRPPASPRWVQSDRMADGKIEHKVNRGGCLEVMECVDEIKRGL